MYTSHESFEVEGKKEFEGADHGDVGIKVGGRKLTDKNLNIYPTGADVRSWVCS
jgi:hypothetical protein